MIYLLPILGTAALAVPAVVAVLWLHKRSANRNPSLIGGNGTVDTTLNPNGSVIIRGEIWRARSVDGRPIASRNAVRVVGSDDLLLLVESL
jgi:membrane-bound serine protease (ClpP class)